MWAVGITHTYYRRGTPGGRGRRVIDGLETLTPDWIDRRFAQVRPGERKRTDEDRIAGRLLPRGTAGPPGLLLSRDLIFTSKITGTAAALGQRVLVAGNVALATAMIEQWRPRVVFVDLAAGDLVAARGPAGLPRAGRAGDPVRRLRLARRHRGPRRRPRRRLRPGPPPQPVHGRASRADPPLPRLRTEVASNQYRLIVACAAIAREPERDGLGAGVGVAEHAVAEVARSAPARGMVAVARAPCVRGVGRGAEGVRGGRAVRPGGPEGLGRGDQGRRASSGRPGRAPPSSAIAAQPASEGVGPGRGSSGRAERAEPGGGAEEEHGVERARGSPERLLQRQAERVRASRRGRRADMAHARGPRRTACGPARQADAEVAVADGLVQRRSAAERLDQGLRRRAEWRLAIARPERGTGRLGERQIDRRLVRSREEAGLGAILRPSDRDRGRPGVLGQAGASVGASSRASRRSSTRRTESDTPAISSADRNVPT